MEENIRLQFDSSIENIQDVNDSFCSGVMRICYPGVNRNGSVIGKRSIERAIPSMFNCPVVCHYSVESDTIGGHDIDVIETDDGDLRFVNLTEAVGVIPEGAKVYWTTVTEESGEEREYLTTEVILWKRANACKKIVDDGVVGQSMEITVKDGQMENGLYMINEFIFTAFCLLGEGVEPCFESASLQLFSKSDVQRQFAMMMKELKESFKKDCFTRSNIGDEADSEKNMKGDEVLDQKNELMQEYGLTAEQIDFNLEDFSLDELKAKFEEIKAADEQKAFVLTEQFRSELIESLRAESIETCFGEMPRYSYVDYDSEKEEVYCYDAEDWNLYGFVYSVNGDHVNVDFETKKRKKFDIVDFDEGEQNSVFSAVFEMMKEKFEANQAERDEFEKQFNEASGRADAMEAELTELRTYKQTVEDAAAEAERENVLNGFSVLKGVKEYDELVESCGEYSIPDLEEKCYAILGRHAKSKFSVEPAPAKGAPKLPVCHSEGPSDEPYGGLFSKYGYSVPDEQR